MGAGENFADTKDVPRGEVEVFMWSPFMGNHGRCLLGKMDMFGKVEEREGG